MIKQDWMVIVAGEALVNALSAEQKARIPHTGFGYESEAICQLQRERASRGITGAEIVKSIYGYGLRYDSGLQGFSILSRAQETGGTLEGAEAWARNWVAQDPDRRYVWRRK